MIHGGAVYQHARCMTEEKEDIECNKDVMNHNIKYDSSCNSSRQKISFGERLFDWTAYGATGLATFVASIFPGYFARYGGGKVLAEPMAKAMTRVGMSYAAAKDVIITTALCVGGFITLPFIKALEDRKIPIVTAINERVGCETDAQAIGERPKQTWASLMKSRAVAWLAVFSSLRGTVGMVGEKKFDQFESAFAEHMVCRPLGKPTHVGGVETTLFKYGRIAAIDVFATAAATVLLYLGSRFFAERDAASSPAAPPHPGPSDATRPLPPCMMAQVAAPVAAKATAFAKRLENEGDRDASLPGRG